MYTDNRPIAIDSILALFSGTLIAIGLTIFAVKTISGTSEIDVNLGYSFWLSLGAMVALFVVVTLLVCDKRQSSSA